MNTPIAANSNGSKIIASGHTAFQEGVTYATRSICDSDCIFSFEVLARSAKSVRVKVNGKTVTRRVSEWQGVEQFKPFGSYSMAAVIGADRVLVEG